ncbi:hypothetical protein ACP3V3_17000 [Vibrio sp. PNB22_3_1]
MKRWLNAFLVSVLASGAAPILASEEIVIGGDSYKDFSVNGVSVGDTFKPTSKHYGINRLNGSNLRSICIEYLNKETNRLTLTNEESKQASKLASSFNDTADKLSLILYTPANASGRVFYTVSQFDNKVVAVGFRKKYPRSADDIKTAVMEKMQFQFSDLVPSLHSKDNGWLSHKGENDKLKADVRNLSTKHRNVISHLWGAYPDLFAGHDVEAADHFTYVDLQDSNTSSTLSMYNVGDLTPTLKSAREYFITCKERTDALVAKVNKRLSAPPSL